MHGGYCSPHVRIFVQISISSSMCQNTKSHMLVPEVENPVINICTMYYIYDSIVYSYFDMLFSCHIHISLFSKLITFVFYFT